MPRRALLPLALVLACGPAVSTDTNATDAGDSTGADGEGTRPTTPGAIYSVCSEVSECAPLEFCVFPDREGGYCGAACAAPDDPSACAPAPGNGATPSCVDIGVPDGRWVCGLDCSDGDCPDGMRCESINTSDGARDVCF